MGKILLKQGDLEGALQYVEKALAIAEKNNDEAHMAILYDNTGLILQNMGKETEKPQLNWEELNSVRVGILKGGWVVYRTKVPGGWLVLVNIASEGNVTLTFYPDPEHKWDGGSVS